MRLPNIDNLYIDAEKLTHYVLNPAHPEGRHKARVFLAALGIGQNDADWLAAAIREKIPAADAVMQDSTTWGTLYRADIQIHRGRLCAEVRTGWICTASLARLTTCFVVGECDEII